MGRKKGRRRRPRNEAEEALLAALGALYAEVEAAFESHSCPGSTECCRFAITGREPYVTSLELVAVKRAIAARGGPLSPRHRALPMVAEERTCPLLNRDGRCAVYADRPFGCRTFWCHRAEALAPVKQAQVNAFVRRLAELAAKHEPGGEHGRPLTRALSG